MSVQRFVGTIDKKTPPITRSTARALLEIAEALGNDTKSVDIVIQQMISQRELAALCAKMSVGC
jgi:hypothetical protein